MWRLVCFSFHSFVYLIRQLLLLLLQEKILYLEPSNGTQNMPLLCLILSRFNLKLTNVKINSIAQNKLHSMMKKSFQILLRCFEVKKFFLSTYDMRSLFTYFTPAAIKSCSIYTPQNWKLNGISLETAPEF